MSDPRRIPIDYAPAHRRQNSGIVVAIIVGSVAGGLTLSSGFLLYVYWGFVVGILCGVLVGYISARASTSRPFLAGIAGNLTAAAVTLLPLTIGIIRGMALSGSIDWWGWADGIGLVVIIFVLPGLIGGLWVWEGRRSVSMELDDPS